MQLRAFFLFIILSALALTAPLRAQEASIGRDDRAIEAQIEAVYASYDRFSQVEAAVSAGVVTLSGTVLETAQISEAEELARKVGGVIDVENHITLDTSVAERVRPAFERLHERTTQAISMLPLIGVGIVVFAVIISLGFILTRFEWPYSRIAPNEFVEDLLRQLVRIVFFIVAFVVALDIVGATALLGTILGAAGIVGLAIGFAVQDTIENYIASVMLSVRQPFRPNDLVKIDSFEGRVMRLTSRATILMTQEGNHVRIPNAKVFKGVIINYTRAPERRFHFTLGINADGDIQKAIHLGLEALGSLAFVLKDPAPMVRVEEVGDSSIILWFGGWIDQRTTNFFAARGEAIRVTKDAMEAGGLELPEPIYRLKLEGMMPGMVQEDIAEPMPKPAKPRSPESAAPPVNVHSPSLADPVEEKVEAERDEGGDEDLLSEHAAQE
ncbi:mechanosensitive ion channel family protein [Kordiimonas gwangyangensis]|uniref:mechanosensitive ion channel family protein n=1 Tax=Kordiimonas gwangyangensis TaxID=288022 RepID=UPI00037ACE5C|nr:mechanosensitive ion channel family protein [Kordiimonas gwangyangensis]